jgi:hypothetical protein
MTSTNVRKTLTDAGYIVIGLGVMTWQQAQIRGRELRRYAEQTSTKGQAALQNGQRCVQSRTKDAQAKVQDQSRAARAKAETQVRDTKARAQELRTQVEKRVEPVVGQVQTQLGAMPEKVVQAMEPVAARVREFGGSAA